MTRWDWLALSIESRTRASYISLPAGLGGIIGDGQLPNAGPEQIFEAYYNVALLDFAHFAADYQFIKNPAYNRDRGPVSVFGLGLHVQY
jgi:high affinity Mn2+ porin